MRIFLNTLSADQGDLEFNDNEALGIFEKDHVGLIAVMGISANVIWVEQGGFCMGRKVYMLGELC